MAEIKKERTTFNSAVRAKQEDGGITPGITAFEKENKTDFEKRFEEQTEQMVEKAQTMKNAEAQFDDIVEKNKEVENNATGYMSAIGKNKPDIVSRWEKQTESMSLQKTKDDYSDYLKNNNGAKVGNINVRKDVEWKNNVVKQTGSASWEDFLSKLNEGDETYIESIDTSEMTEVGKKYVNQMKSAVEARKKIVKSMDEYDGYKESTDFLGGVAELKTTDGKSYGYVSGKAIDAIRGNTLENYRPISDSESEVLSEYERETTGYTVSELKKRIEELEKIPAEKYVYDDKNTPELEAVALSRVYSADEIAEIKKNTEKANKKKITDTYSIWDYAFDLVSEPISFLGGSDAYLKNSERIAERKEKSDEEKKKASEREEAVSSAANMAAREKTEKVTLAADWEENSSLTQIEQYAYVYVKSIDSDVLIGSTGLDHGLNRKADATAKVTMKIGDILSNAIAVNELEPRKQSSGSYVLLGIGADEEGDYYPTRIVVNQFEVDEVEVLDVLYAVNAKKEKKNQSPNGARLPANAVPTIKGSPSTVTVAELLNVVKNFFPDVLSEDVLRKYGIERPKSTLSDSVKFSLSENKKASEEETKGKNYTYDSLVEKDDMFVTQLTEDVPYTDDGKIDRNRILSLAIKNVRDKGNSKNTEEKAYVYIPSIGKNVLVGKDGLRHGLTRRSDSNAKDLFSWLLNRIHRQ